MPPLVYAAIVLGPTRCVLGLLSCPGVTVVDAWLEKMTMTEQLQLVQKSCIMIGAHGYVCLCCPSTEQLKVMWHCVA